MSVYVGKQRYGNGLPDFRAVPLFGAAYRGKAEAEGHSSLTHVVDVNKQPFRALCGRPKTDSLMDDSYVWKDPQLASCSTCLSKYRRLIGA